MKLPKFFKRVKEIKNTNENSIEETNVISKTFLDKTNKNLNSNLKSINIFENINDARSIYLAERLVKKYLIYITFFFVFLSITQLILIIFLFPLKEKEPYLIGFSEASQNFVTIEKANRTISSNEALIRSLIGSYILNRETINHIDDQKRYEIIKYQSNSKVWNNFEAIVAQEKSIYTNVNLIREIQIINISKWRDGYANVDVVIKLLNSNGMNLESEKRYRITIVYKFINQKITFENIPINPTGFQVIDYSITQIAVIKDLDLSKKLNKSNSKIQNDLRKTPTPFNNQNNELNLDL